MSRLPMRRREFLARSALVGVAALRPDRAYSHEIHGAGDPLPVAGITTEYRRNSHADVILGKLLAGYDQAGGPGPALQLVSLYTDQVPKNDLSRPLAEKYGFRICNTIEEAITRGGNEVAVAGVLLIGEHGNYPLTEDTGQRMYPRRRLFEGIAATFQKSAKVVPVFNDKHLAYSWEDAQFMYQTARRLKIPMMAGSSIPVMWREPPLTVPIGSRITGAVAVGRGGLESYGFHALEGLQCILERRSGGETGVANVQVVRGAAIWEAERMGRWSRDLLEAALAPKPGGAAPASLEERLPQDAVFYLIQYRDGLRAALAMLNRLAEAFGVAVRVDGEAKPVALQFLAQEEAPFGHFAWLLAAIEHMIRTGRPAYPVERTLLTTGILDRAMHSTAEAGRRYETPELAIEYTPADWPFATTPVGVPPSAKPAS